MTAASRRIAAGVGAVLGLLWVLVLGVVAVGMVG